MMSGRGLTEATSEILFQAACEMFIENQDRKSVKADFCEGIVTTEFQYAALGGIAGMVFSATIEDNRLGKTKVVFLIRKKDLEAGYSDNGVWMSRDQLKAEKALLN